MPLTPNSSLTAYATPADLFLYCDIRTVADYASDNGMRLGGAPNPVPSVVATSPRVLDLLMVASGRLEGSCIKGNRYQPTDLQNLNGVSKRYLVWLVCQVARAAIFEARPDLAKIDEPYKEACAAMEALGDGSLIFSFAETQAAGVMTDYVETPQDVANRNLTTRSCHRLFGRRNNREQPWP